MERINPDNSHYLETYEVNAMSSGGCDGDGSCGNGGDGVGCGH